MRRFLLAAVILCAAFASACGGGGGEGANGITGPSSRIPNVVGNYSGTTTVTFPELGQSITCPTSTSVTQSGSTVSIAPLILAGQCGNVSVPFGQGTIDATGSLGGQTTTTYTDPSCGTYNVIASGGFFGRDLRLSVNATSRTCYNLNMTINLSH